MYIVLGDTYAGSHCGYGDYRHANKRSISQAEIYNSVEKPQAKIYDGKWLVPKQKLLMPERVAIALQEDGWLLRNKIIWHKCIGENTRLFAKVNGRLVSWCAKDVLKDGSNKRVELPCISDDGQVEWKPLLAQERTFADVLQITFSSGEKVWATPEHRWILLNQKRNGWSRPRVGAPKKNDGYLLKRSDELKIGDKVPLASLILRPKELVDGQSIYGYDAGYFVGAYLAEGSPIGDGKGLQFSLGDTDKVMVSRLETFVRGKLQECASTYRYGKEIVFHVFGKVACALIEKFVVGLGAKVKHLTADAWAQPLPFIEGIVDGFLDGDGHLEEGGRYTLTITSNKMLCDDLMLCCRLLNYAMRYRNVRVRYQKGVKEAIRAWIRKDRSREKQSMRFGVLGFATVKKILPLTEKHPVWDLKVGGNGFFCLASGLVTHNSNAMPSSKKDALTPSYEEIFHFVRGDCRSDWFILGNRPNPEKLAEKHELWLKVRKWWGLGGVKHRSEIPKKYLSACINLDYYYNLDAIRIPHKTEFAPFNLRVRDVKRGKGGISAFGELKASEEEIKNYVYPESGRIRRLIQRLYEITKQIRGQSHYQGKNVDLHGWKEACSNAKAYRDGLKILEQEEKLTDGEKKFLWDYVQNHLGHPLGKNPTDVVKHDLAVGRIGNYAYDDPLHTRPEHPLGKNPGDIITERVQANLQHFLRRGSGGHYTYGGLDSPEAKHEHPLGRNPGDVVTHRLKENPRISSRTHEALPPQPELDPQRAFHSLGKNPSDIILNEGQSVDYNYGSRSKWGRCGGGRSFADWKAKHPRATRLLGKNPSDFWSVNTKPSKGSHFAVFPEAIVVKPILSSCSHGGVVLDPMCGSGTTCVVAKKLGRKFIGVDINPGYVDLARKRLAEIL